MYVIMKVLTTYLTMSWMCQDDNQKGAIITYHFAWVSGAAMQRLPVWEYLLSFDRLVLAVTHRFTRTTRSSASEGAGYPPERRSVPDTTHAAVKLGAGYCSYYDSHYSCWHLWLHGAIAADIRTTT